jgi:hypothetical protein
LNFSSLLLTTALEVETKQHYISLSLSLSLSISDNSFFYQKPLRRKHGIDHWPAEATYFIPSTIVSNYREQRERERERQENQNEWANGFVNE